jgi:antitoxin (DNA-binding transcriptional repressor) of toxin-antitoxin stability system
MLAFPVCAKHRRRYVVSLRRVIELLPIDSAFQAEDVERHLVYVPLEDLRRPTREIRKARLSGLARDAAKGEVTMLTDYGKPIAMISPIEQKTKTGSGSDAGEFRKALLSLPITWKLVSRATDLSDPRGMR